MTQSPTTVQKIITSTGQIITQQVQGNVISSANLQQLLQQRPGQKILIQQTQGGVQKLLVAAPSPTTQIQQGTGEKRIIIQNAAGQQQQIILQQPNQNNVAPQQQLVTIGGQKLILQSPGTQAQVQQIKTITSPVQQQPIQFQIQQQDTQPQQTQQIVAVQANGNNIAQQLVQGKIQVMNMNGQQVLVKNVGSNQVIVGQVKSNQAQLTPVKQTIVASPQQNQQQIVKTVQMQSIASPTETTSTSSANPPTSSNEHAALLANHPPGTIIKCVTASVMQTASGPRIVLQGLQGTEFTQQQSLIVQQQVKQQLMKGK